MKKILIATAGIIMTFAFLAPTAQAYTIVNGERVFGYVAGYAPEPGPEQAAVKPLLHEAGEPTIIAWGNTRVIDIVNILRPEDRTQFLRMIDAIRLRY